MGNIVNCNSDIVKRATPCYLGTSETLIVLHLASYAWNRLIRRQIVGEIAEVQIERRQTQSIFSSGYVWVKPVGLKRRIKLLTNIGECLEEYAGKPSVLTLRIGSWATTERGRKILCLKSFLRPGSNHRVSSEDFRVHWSGY